MPESENEEGKFLLSFSGTVYFSNVAFIVHFSGIFLKFRGFRAYNGIWKFLTSLYLRLVFTSTLFVDVDMIYKSVNR